jgi:gamma-glutamylcyclotransferase (GGCT)/AIG2-like uncharacterized protein YtfP
MPYLFVYGTLMRGFALHHHLEDARFVGGGSIAGRLHDLGEFPAMLPAKRAGQRIRGELYRLSDPVAQLPRLDAVEGCRAGRGEALFVREAHQVRLDRGGRITAWVYRYAREATAGSRIPRGDYRASRFA